MLFLNRRLLNGRSKRSTRSNRAAKAKNAPLDRSRWIIHAKCNTARSIRTATAKSVRRLGKKELETK